MAKKKNNQKKHKFKHVETGEVVSGGGSGAAESTSGTVLEARPTRAGAGVSERDFSYVTGDLSRIAGLAAALVVLQIILYFVLAHTVAGAAIYSLEKV